jgi:hypothetical protein
VSLDQSRIHESSIPQPLLVEEWFLHIGPGVRQLLSFHLKRFKSFKAIANVVNPLGQG